MGRFVQSVWKAAKEFSADDCMSIGAAIAYYAIFSLPPLLVLVLMIAGYFGVEPDRIRKAVQDQWGVAATAQDSSSETSGEKPSSDVESAATEKPRSGQFGVISRIVGGVILLFSASGLFAQLQYALNRAWNLKPDPMRGGVIMLVAKRVVSFGMVLIVAFLLL